MTLRSHTTRRQFEVTRWRLRTASSTSAFLTLSVDARVSGNTHQVHERVGPCHLIGEDDDSELSCRLFALPCSVLQHLLSLCDGRTVCHPAPRWPSLVPSHSHGCAYGVAAGSARLLLHRLPPPAPRRTALARRHRRA